MHWIDVAMILFSCVAVNHLGLVHAIEDITDRELPIINCPRCFSFWCVLSYMLLTSHMIILSFATSFLASSLAPWVELLMGFTDNLYNKLYDTIYPTTEIEGNDKAESEKDS